MIRVQRALISVYDKTGLIEFAQGLSSMGVEIISTGGTYQALANAGIPVTPVSAVTGFPEILDGRVKTLHPKVHGGILAIRDLPEHRRQMEEHGITGIDMVVVNLYPFEATIAKPGVTVAEAVEQIDIGGPTMIRSAAKNYPYVAVVVNPPRYADVLQRLRESGGTLSESYGMVLAHDAFEHTAAYDTAIEAWFRRQLQPGSQGEQIAQSSKIALPDEVGAALPDALPDTISFSFVKAQELRYGENPHQRAAFYKEPGFTGASLASAKQLHGKELSFNNINDTAAALQMAQEFNESVVVAVKHTNPCGLAVGATLFDAYRKAYDADPVSIFGGIVACNRSVDAQTAAEMAKIFLEVIIAPSFEPDALDILTKKRDIRLLALNSYGPPTPYLDYKRVPGGLLVQDTDVAVLDPAKLQVVTRREPTEAEWNDLRFGWRVVKHVKSNAIVVAKAGQTLGVGAGQMNRILPTRLALEQAGDRARGAVLASDAFFPFPDVVEACAAAGISAIIQPGGAKRDADSIEAADKAGVSMVFTAIRHFKH